MRISVHIAAVLTLLATVQVRPARAQEEPAKPYNDFDRLIPTPTGQNGYEEFVRAADMIRNAAAFKQFEQASADQPPTLAAKRRAISDPAVRAALDTLRAGLLKPVKSIRAHLDDETIFPELAGFRALARALGHVIYVELADGRVSSAIDTLGVALKFGYVVQLDTLIAGLVAIAVDAIAIRPIGDHLDQLALRDCDKLLALAREWLLLPDPAIAVLESDRRGSLALLNKYKADPVKLLKMLEPGNSRDETEADRQRRELLEQKLTGEPNTAIALFDQAGKVIDSQYAHIIGSLKQPAWERKPVTNPDESTPVGCLVSAMGGARMLSQVVDRYAREQAQIQLLGVHAAIRRRLWEHNTLPASLEELSLGAMILDPFSGKPFEYRIVEGNRYTLSSVGPINRDPQAANAGQRTPIRFGAP